MWLREGAGGSLDMALRKEAQSHWEVLLQFLLWAQKIGSGIHLSHDS